jgi:hypothetical protein
MNEQRKPWTWPYTTREWVSIFAQVLVALVVSFVLLLIYLTVFMRF